MNPKFKPMLATQIDDLDNLKYSVLVSPKLDGIRSCIFGGVALSRSLKPIPNLSIQAWAKANADTLEGLDGEFIVGSPTDPEVFRSTTSFVMSHDKVQPFTFYVFDKVLEGITAAKRQEALQDVKLPLEAKVLPQLEVRSKDGLEAFRTQCVEMGYEGAMVKSLDGLYKYGRSSVKEGLLLKMKLFSTEEFKIVGFDCKYHNSNEAKTNELGRTARSTSKDGMIPMDTLGVIYLVTPDGTEFGCGSGFDDKTRDELWKDQHNLVGKLCSVKFFEVGGYKVPRFPVYRGIRSELDL